MILVDANLLLYAYHAGAKQHAAARAWLEAALSGPEPVGFPWPSVWAFLRVATNRRVFERPLSVDEATAAVSSWLAQPNAVLVGPGERHWELVQALVKQGQATGPLVMDAALAALALEQGATLYSSDQDFARFEQLEWVNPLAAP